MIIPVWEYHGKKGVFKMKSKAKLFGVIAVVAIIMFSMAACDSGSGANTDPKSLTITGITDLSGGAGVWIFAQIPEGNNFPTLTAVVDKLVAL